MNCHRGFFPRVCWIFMCINLLQAIPGSLWSYMYMIAQFLSEWISSGTCTNEAHKSLGQRKSASTVYMYHRICTGHPIRDEHEIETSCDAYIPSHIGETLDLMQSCLIQLTCKYINHVAILCSASGQCFIMLQVRWSPKLITCTVQIGH